ncbi:MAG: hypothetical protein DYG87_07005 [Anaerolineae bacterium CFX3]|nr:hypothetical protein [Anaerolineae bacterium CFX3]MCQ3946860.1 hypothetical protein [Anaerolineae bacterium]RIK25736.1 MAG: hypothetical protein DCC54_09460 [Anaerolineae bacterium]
MGDYKRTTRECTLDSLRPELGEALRAHVEKYNLGDILADAKVCVETASEKTKKGLFGGGETVYTAAVLTKDWLVWANSGTKTPVHAMSARLNQITVQDYAQSSFAKMIPDTGVNVNGLKTDSPEAGTTFIGLEENAAGVKFRQALIAAAQGA